MTARTLVLLRHAKAERPDQLSDVDRPLTARGHHDAAAVGAWLAGRGLWPGLVLCSPARRTRETWRGVQVALGPAVAADVMFDPVLYEGGVDEMLELVQETGPEVEVLMIVGHNPTVSVLSTMLDPAAGGDDSLRTAGIAVHRFEGAWTECGPSRAPLAASHTARTS